jgi:hypothetical protein
MVTLTQALNQCGVYKLHYIGNEYRVEKPTHSYNPLSAVEICKPNPLERLLSLTR